MLLGFAVIPGALAKTTPTPITSCGTIISAPGVYTIANNLSCSTNAVDIESSHVTVQVNGHTISGNGNYAGFFVNRTNPQTVTDIHILGPGLVMNFQEGVDTGSNTNGLEVGLLTFTSNSDRGLQIRNGSGLNFHNNVLAKNAGPGIFLNTGVTQSVIQGNQVTGNSQAIGRSGAGIWLDPGTSNNQIYLNNVSGNNGDGISLQPSDNGNQIELNAVYGNTGSGIHILSGSTGNSVLGNVSTANEGTGTYDLQDDNSCGSNSWYLNDYFTKNEACLN